MNQEEMDPKADNQEVQATPITAEFETNNTEETASINAQTEELPVEEVKPEDYKEQDKETTIAVEKFLEGKVTWKKINLE